MSIDLANLSLEEHRHPPATVIMLAGIVAIDPPSVARLRTRHSAPLLDLGGKLHRIVAAVAVGSIDSAAKQVNALLDAAPAHPHLARDTDGVWRLHHHPASSGLVAMWTAICAEALARVIGTGHAHRLGICEADDCNRAFLDESKNSSRRFCSTTCQNRAKAAAFRGRQRNRPPSL